MLHDVLPGLRSSQPSSITVEELPALRCIVAVDNTRDPGLFASIMDKAPAVIDYRDVSVWTAGAKESRIVKEARASLHKDDAINLQFTRSARLLPKTLVLRSADDETQWYDRTS